MRIRELEENDNRRIATIIRSSLESVSLDIPGTAYFDPYLDTLTDYYNTQPAAKYWVVVNHDDKAIGGVGIGPFGNHRGVGELQKLYLAPEAQGKGLAKKLIKTALQFAKKYYEYCYLETFEKLEAANNIYIKFGFKEMKEPLSGSEHNACDSWYIKKL